MPHTGISNQGIGKLAFHERKQTDHKPGTVVGLGYNEEPDDPFTQSCGESGLPNRHQDQQKVLRWKEGTPEVHRDQGWQHM